MASPERDEGHGKLIPWSVARNCASDLLKVSTDLSSKYEQLHEERRNLASLQQNIEKTEWDIQLYTDMMATAPLHQFYHYRAQLHGSQEERNNLLQAVQRKQDDIQNNRNQLRDIRIKATGIRSKLRRIFPRLDRRRPIKLLGPEDITALKEIKEVGGMRIRFSVGSSISAGKALKVLDAIRELSHGEINHMDTWDVFELSAEGEFLRIQNEEQ